MSEVVDLTDDLQPWQREEWRARCEAERNNDVIRAVAAFARATHGFSLHDACDEEMWRKVHDPVGARRLNLTRMVKARGLDPTDKYWAAYIQRCCEDESRTPAAQRKGLGARLDSLTNLAALKEECRAHGLPASGTKAKLSQRLRDYASGVEPAKGKRRRGA